LSLWLQSARTIEEFPIVVGCALSALLQDIAVSSFLLFWIDFFLSSLVLDLSQGRLFDAASRLLGRNPRVSVALSSSIF